MEFIMLLSMPVSLYATLPHNYTIPKHFRHALATCMFIIFAKVCELREVDIEIEFTNKAFPF